MRIDVWGNEVVRGGLEGPVRKKKKKNRRAKEKLCWKYILTHSAIVK